MHVAAAARNDRSQPVRPTPSKSENLSAKRSMALDGMPPPAQEWPRFQGRRFCHKTQKLNADLPLSSPLTLPASAV